MKNLCLFCFIFNFILFPVRAQKVVEKKSHKQKKYERIFKNFTNMSLNPSDSKKILTLENVIETPSSAGSSKINVTLDKDKPFIKRTLTLPNNIANNDIQKIIQGLQDEEVLIGEDNKINPFGVLIGCSYEVSNKKLICYEPNFERQYYEWKTREINFDPKKTDTCRDNFNSGLNLKIPFLVKLNMRERGIEGKKNINVKVVDDKSQPLQNAKITVTGSSLNYETDSQGNATISLAPKQIFLKLKTSLENYEDNEVEVNLLDKSNEITITLVQKRIKKQEVRCYTDKNEVDFIQINAYPGASGKKGQFDSHVGGYLLANIPQNTHILLSSQNTIQKYIVDKEILLNINFHDENINKDVNVKIELSLKTLVIKDSRYKDTFGNIIPVTINNCIWLAPEVAPE